jgi:hypothetical protein
MTMPSKAGQNIYRTRDGHVLCNSHRTTGAPNYFYPGCEMCEAAKAKGVVRPNINSVPKKLRGRRRHLEKQIDWSKVKPENKSPLSCAIQLGRHTGLV